MAWPRFRNPIQKLIVPTADLGLQELDFSALEFPGDVPLVVALQAVQTPTGPRIVQNSSTGQNGRAASSPWTKIRDATEAAGNTGVRPQQGAQGIQWGIEVIALNGAPTNVMYRAAFSFDGGTTWYEGASVTVTAAGFAGAGIGLGTTQPGAGNDVKAATSTGMPLPPLIRLDWSLTAGTAPTVQHRIWEALF